MAGHVRKRETSGIIPLKLPVLMEKEKELKGLVVEPKKKLKLL